MKKTGSANGRKHGMRSKTSVVIRQKTILTFEPGSRIYHWTTDRGRSRPVIRH